MDDADRQYISTLIPEGIEYAVLLPGANWTTKRWPAERYAELMGPLRKRFGLATVVAGGPTDQALAAGIPADFNVIGITTLRQTIALIARSRLVIANDTPANLKSQLGSTVVEMRFDGDGRSQRAATLLTGNVNGQVERDDGTLRITSNDGARILIDVLRTLDTNDIEPDTLAVREPSLDDVFLSLTGHRAEADGEPNEQPVKGRRGGTA